MTMEALRRKTAETTEKIKRAGFEVIEMWEHVFQSMKNTSPEMKEFLKTHEVMDRLNPRDAFFGGRTNAVQLYYEGKAKYIDFTSLYPWVNKYCR